MDMEVYYDATSSGDDSPPQVHNPFIPQRFIADNPYGEGTSAGPRPVYIEMQPMGRDKERAAAAAELNGLEHADVVEVEVGADPIDEPQPVQANRKWIVVIMAVIYAIALGLFLVVIRLLMTR